MVRRAVLVCAVLLIAAANPEPQLAKIKPGRIAGSAENGDISGYYTCKGKEASGKLYSGIAVVTRQREVYLIQWMIGAGATFTGIGIRNGDTLSASWALPGDKGAMIRGANIYKIEPGPRLVGHWASIPGPGVVQHETMTFLKKVEETEEVN
jgi:hypothetical protein